MNRKERQHKAKNDALEILNHIGEVCRDYRKANKARKEKIKQKERDRVDVWFESRRLIDQEIGKEGGFLCPVVDICFKWKDIKITFLLSQDNSPIGVKLIYYDELGGDWVMLAFLESGLFDYLELFNYGEERELWKS